MTSPMKPHDGDPFHGMAHEVYVLLTKGSGSAHARIRTARDVLANLATVNYEAGHKAGVEFGKSQVPAPAPLQYRDEGQYIKHPPASTTAQAVGVPEVVQQLDPGAEAPPQVDLAAANLLATRCASSGLALDESQTNITELVHAMAKEIEYLRTFFVELPGNPPTEGA